jgi:gliding motility associated protien GldN
MKMQRDLFAMTLVAITFSANAQNVLDGFYTPEKQTQKRPVTYVPVREADVMWQRRVWRTIDLREKINQPLYFPTTEINNRKSMFDVIKMGILTGQITAYGNPVNDDEFTKPLSLSEAKKVLMHIDTLYIPDPITEELKPFIDSIKVGSADIKQYWVKEDWFFDKQRSVMDVRIIGICPLKENKGPDGEVRGYQPMFWVYFPECRPLFAKAEVFNRSNDAERRTLDEIFIKRFFGSYINKVSNVYDRSIAEYTTGLDALLEAEKAKENIFLFEQDVWHY